MSYIHKAVILIPDAVQIKIIDCSVIRVIGKLGVLDYLCHKLINIKLQNTMYLMVYIDNSVNNKRNKSLIGTTRALINTMITGVTIGFTKKLQLVGIGYRAIVNNNTINLIIGLSHSINYVLPKHITVTCQNQTEIILNSINKQLVGQVAADLRALRPPEPFKGKGIRYVNEAIRIKDTKKK